MRFVDKYSKLGEAKQDTLEVSNDAFCIGEMLQSVIDKLEHVRRSFDR